MALLRLANVLTTAVVAHILDPRAFGVYAVALTAYGIVSAIGEFGLGTCLLRADLDIDSLAPTLVTFAVTTNTVQAGAMAAFAHPIAAALGSGAAAGPIRVLAIAMLVAGISAVPSSQLVRDFRQDKIFLANVVGFVPSTGLLIVLALSGGGAMSFAWSMAAGSVVSALVMIASVGRKYPPGFSRSALSVLVKFGLPMGGANVVNYVLLNTDYALVGHLVGAVGLGSYVLAFNVASWPSSLLGFMVNNVAMPAFSRVRDDAERLKEAMSRALRALSLVVMPMSALTMALARPLVLAMYGSKWAVSVHALSILTVYGAISIICVLFANILASLGHARFILAVQLIWLAALVPAIALGVHRYGIVGAAIGHIVVIVPVVLPIYLFGLRKVASPAALVKALLPPLLAASAAGFVAVGAASLFTLPLAQLAAGLAAGGLTYLIAAGGLAGEFLSEKMIARLHARRVLGVYAVAARLAGVRAASPPKHAARPGRPTPQPAADTAGPVRSGAALRPASRVAQVQSPAEAAAALELLLSFSRPEDAAPGPARKVPVRVAPRLEHSGLARRLPAEQAVGMPE
jgi:PST family polysaccharide transporter